MISVDRDGLKYWANFCGCDNPKGFLGVQFYSSFELETPLTPECANDSNVQ